jgi:hypothetical protein
MLSRCYCKTYDGGLDVRAASMNAWNQRMFSI